MKIPNNYQTPSPKNYLRLQKSSCRHQVHQEESPAIRRWVEAWVDAKCKYLEQQKVDSLYLNYNIHPLVTFIGQIPIYAVKYSLFK